ncbi:MAG: AsmA family protein [Alphaproteobacteria bacterium]
MKKLLIGLVAVGVLLIAAILIAPSFVDWNAHKQEITAMVREATGRELTIRGNIDVTILPSPALRVEDVRLSSIEGAVSPEMIRLPEARIGFAFAPLLEGRLSTVVTLVRPTVNLEKLKDGRVNWDFAAKQEQVPAEQQSADAPGSGLPFDVKLDSFRIVNGTVSYHDASTGTLERMESLNTEISFDSLRGPFRIDGAASVHGIPIVLRASTGVIKPEAPLFVMAEVTTADGESKLRLNGTVSAPDGASAVNGELEANSKSVASFAKSIFRMSAPGVFDQPFMLRGNLTGSEKAVSLSAIEIEFGDARATGEFTAELGDAPRLTGLVRSGNLNLDAFLDGGKPAEAAPTAAAGKNPGIAASGPASDPQAKDPVESSFSLPANLDASLTIAADIIQYNGALVRDLAVKAALKNGRAAIEDISAVMPGNSFVAVKGGIAAVDGKPDLDLHVSSRSDNLREILEWVGVDIGSVPADRLRRFSLSTTVTGAPKNLTAKDIKMQLDSSNLTGGLALVLRDRPAFGLRLVVDRVNLDAYVAGRDSAMQPAPAQSPTADTAAKQDTAQSGGLGGLEDALRALEGFDANIDATIKSLIVARTPATDLRADFTILNGGLEIRHAGIGDLAGLRGSIKGRLDRSKDQPSIDADYTVEVTDVARFARFVDRPQLMNHKGNGRLASSGKLAGNLERMVVTARLEGLGVTVDIDGAATALLASPEFKLATSVRSPELVQLVRLGMEDYAPAAGKLGPVDVSFRLEGSRNHVKADAINGHAGPVALRGLVEVTLGEPRPKLRAAISTSEISLDLFLPPESRRRSDATPEYRIIPAAASGTTAPAPSRWSSDPIDIAMLEALDAEVDLDMAVLAKDPYRLKDSKLRVRLDEGKLSLERFHAGFSAGTVTVTGSLAAEQRKIAGTLNASLNGVEVSDLVVALRNYQARLGPVRFGAKMRGPVTVTATLNTLGGSERELVSGLAGSARIAGQLNTEMSSETRQAGAVAGLAGALLGSKVKEIRGITDAVQGTDVLVSAFEGPSTLNGDIIVERGVATTRNLVLVGRGGRALTAGTANLPGWTLDSVTDITLGQDSDPYLTAQVAGALDDPYLRKVSGTLLRGRPVSTQPQGGGQSGAKIVEPQQPAQAPAADRKRKPEDVLKDLLQGLSR